MRYMIENTYVKIGIDSKGAELQSIQDYDGVEYLWQGDKKYWGGKAPNLFPYIGRLTDGKYYVEGKCNEMTKHGFARDMEFVLEKQSKDMLHFSLEENQDTLKMYPYKFKFSVIYTLVESELNICYKVENKEDKSMYFGVGAHPGFQVPLEKDLSFEDYYLEFAKESKPQRIGVNDAGYLEGEDTLFGLENDTIIPLQHDLFDHDAIVLKDMDKTIRLKSDKGTKGLEITYEDMDYLGIWHAVKMDAPYVCIEPWTSLPSKAGVVEHLEEQDNLIELEKLETYENNWSIKILNLHKKTNLEGFVQLLVEEEKSSHTIDKYTRDVMRFLEFIQEIEIEKKIVVSYKEYLKLNYAPTSVNSMIAAVNKYLDYMEIPEAKVKQLKVQREVFLSTEKELTLNDYQKLVRTADQNGDARLSMLIQTICSTGIRVSELAFLTVESIANGIMRVACKGKNRMVFLPAELCKKLRNYCKQYHLNNGVVFRTKNGKSLNRSNIWKMMKSLCKLAGVLETKVFPHNLRHLFARTYYKIEKDISRLADILGHSNINTTRIYTMESGMTHMKQMNRINRTFLLPKTT